MSFGKENQLAKTSISNDVDMKRFSLRMSRDLYTRVHHYAADRDLSITTAINEIVLKFLNNQFENS